MINTGEKRQLNRFMEWRKGCGRFCAFVVAFAITEASIMLLLPRFLPHVSSMEAAAIDSLLLVTILTPIVHSLFIKPLSQRSQERIAALDLFRKSESRWHLLEENLSDVIWVVDLNLAISYISPSVAKLRGYSAEEAAAQPLEETLTPNSLARLKRLLLDELARARDRKSTPFTIELEQTCKDGSTVWTDVRAFFLFNDKREPTGLMGISRNITERKLFEEALEQAYVELNDRKVLMESVLSSIQSGIIVTDTSMRIRLVNRYVAERYCVNAKAVQGQRLGDVCQTIDQSIRSGQDAAEIPDRTGNDQIIGYKRFDLRGGDGSIIGHIITFVDVSEIMRVRREMRLKERLAAIGELVARIAHEIRNPLFGMTAASQILSRELAMTPPQRELMDSLLREAKRLNQMVEELLTSCREPKLEITENDLREVVSTAVRLIEALAQEKQIRIELRLPAAPVAVSLDGGKIEQVLLNILKNSVEATPADGIIAIETGEWRDSVFVRVADSGPGIPQHVMDKIFDIFYTTKRTGSGMGLTISKTIVQAHGGTITCHKNGIGGATFVVSLPKGAGG